MRHHGRRLAAYTLIELLTAIALIAILMSVAVPGFTEMRLNAQRRSALDEFWHAVFYARSEAIKRNSVVEFCRSDDGVNCNSANPNWAEGWMVFENLDGDYPGIRDSDEPLLRYYEARRGSRITSNRETFSFRAFTQGSINGTITFCDSRGSAEARALIISHTGRPRISRRDASNKALTC